MKEKPLISIVMPAYNAEKTISDAIESVLSQTYGNWELLIIDDGSSDHTITIAQHYSNADRRVALIQNKQNSGVSVSRNRGISEASGEWVAFLDSDDKWDPQKLEKQARIIRQKGNVDLVFTGSSFFNSVGKNSGYILQVPESLSYHNLLKQNVIPCSSVVVRKELAQKYPMKMDEMHEDYAVWLQILRDGYCAYGINEPLLYYRLSENSKSGNKKKAAVMTYRVYQFMGLNGIQTFYYFLCYTWRNLKKYFHINHTI